jgi:quaternary ammonium compound-resistance protein SugE
VELLFVALGGLLVGVVAYYALPHRETRGAALVPAIGGVLASVVWVALTWAGLKYDEVIIWLVTAAVTVAGTLLAATALGRSRTRRDQARLRQLSSSPI